MIFVKIIKSIFSYYNEFDSRNGFSEKGKFNSNVKLGPLEIFGAILFSYLTSKS